MPGPRRCRRSAAICCCWPWLLPFSTSGIVTSTRRSPRPPRKPEMEAWQESLAASLGDPVAVAARFGLDPAATAAVAARYPLRLTPTLLTLIERADDPLGRQFLPDPRELAADGLAEDPLAEGQLAPLPAV